MGNVCSLPFVQDDWRITNQLTLNLGFRWNYESPLTDRFDRQIIGFDDSTISPLGSTAVQGGLLFANENNRFAFKRDLEQLAAAYRCGRPRVSSKVVLRGGWGMLAVEFGDTPTDGFESDDVAQHLGEQRRHRAAPELGWMRRRRLRQAYDPFQPAWTDHGETSKAC